MASWNVKNLDEAQALVSGEPLGSPRIGADPISVELAPNLSFDGGGAKLAINPRGAFTVAVLNDEQDTDADGVIQKDEATTPQGALSAHFRLKDGPWIKLRAEAGIKASVAAELQDLVGIEVGADASVAVAQYRKGSTGTSARDAFLAAIAAPAFATSLPDVQALDIGDVLMFRRGGSLSAGVTVTVSDIFTGQIGTLGRLLGSAGPIVLAVSAGATLEVEVSVKDEFLVVFSRHGKDAWRAGVRKAEASKVSASVDAGIEARVKNPKVLERLVKDAIAAAIGQPLNKVKALLTKRTLADLKPAEKKLFDAVAERLGAGGVIASLDDLGGRIADLEGKAEGLITDVIRARVTLSFAYEYSRIAQHVNLLQVTLSGKALAQFHGDLVAGRSFPLLDAVRQGAPGVTLDSYLNQKTLTRAAAWGFSLGIGKWVDVGGQDFRKITKVERTNAEGALQRSYLGTRGYTGKWVGESFEWSVDLRADMKGYAKPVKVNSYTFGLHVAWGASQKSLSQPELEQWLDVALLWKVLSDRGATEVRDALAPAIGTNAHVSVQLTVPNTVVRSVLPLLATTTPEAYAGAMAAAMPWMSTFPGRQDARLRRALYTPLWERALSELTLSGTEWGRVAADHLRAAGFAELAAFERARVDASDPFSFAGLVQINGDARQTCLAFATGANILQTSIVSDQQDQDTIEAAYRKMDDLWTQSHHVRAVGVRVLDLAIQTGQLHEITRTLLVQGGGLKQDLVVTA